MVEDLVRVFEHIIELSQYKHLERIKHCMKNEKLPGRRLTPEMM